VEENGGKVVKNGQKNTPESQFEGLLWSLVSYSPWRRCQRSSKTLRDGAFALLFALPAGGACCLVFELATTRPVSMTKNANAPKKATWMMTAKNIS
jgi:hypothetical protein